jgi:formamidopyrimidine-DNA glycosylase
VPELPDVEHFRRTLAHHGAGRRIREVVTTDPAIVRNAGSEAVADAMRGVRLGEPERRGKWVVLWSDGPALLLHFGMTGDVIPAPGPEGRHTHDRLILELEEGELRYRNMRKFGGVWLALDAGDAEDLLATLGPDALTIDRRVFAELLRRRRGRIKPVLMDQTALSGVGNLVADEVLWRARIHPARPVTELSDEDVARLHRALRGVLGTWVDRYGSLPGRWLIHVRGPDAACPRCGSTLERSVVGGRTTYHCPRCQPT